MILFGVSKFLELFDTVILIIRHPEKPVQLLHWWHHLTVLLYSWYGIIFHQSSGPFFASINSFIHSFMYYYYFKAATGKPPKWGFFLTIAQVNNLLILDFTNGNWNYYKHNVDEIMV
jgi:elongation of very long chain fatty acids protein 6